MYQYHVTGQLAYLKMCPKAPGVELCDPPSTCEGHVFTAYVDLFIVAPDEERATLAALGKLKSAFPWPLWDGAPAIAVADPPTVPAQQRDPGGPPLPGFEDLIPLRARNGRH